MPFVKVNIHFVWSTKNREPFLNTKDIRAGVWQHIKENSLKKGIFVDCVNGYADHCHCVISLGVDQTIQKLIQLIKGESSFWINNKSGFEFPQGKRFEWQDEYFAVSVSQSQIDIVRNYLRNQEIHHQKRTFKQECDELIQKFGFEKFKDLDKFG